MSWEKRAVAHHWLKARWRGQARTEHIGTSQTSDMEKIPTGKIYLIKR